MKRVLVWDLPVRIFHWVFAALITCAFAIAHFAGEHSPLFVWHMWLGILSVILVAWRIVWGFAGTRYARFSALLHGPQAVLNYLRSLPINPTRRHIGHNPASSWAIFAMLLLALAMVLTGFNGAEDSHEAISSVLLVVIATHILGVILHTVRHKENIVRSMIDGKKAAPDEQAIDSQRPVAAAILSITILVGLAILATGLDPASGELRLPFSRTVVSLHNGKKDKAGEGQHKDKKEHRREHNGDDD